MPIDYTALLNKLQPDRDGEPHTHLRVGTVDAVNADGTLDIEMSSGIVVPSVPRLFGAYTPAGAVVQILAYRGSLLVIGSVGSNTFQNRAAQSGTFALNMVSSSTSFVLAVTFPVAYPVGVTPMVFLNHVDGGAQSQFWIIHATSISNTGFNIVGTRAAAANQLTNSPVDWIAFDR